jgi:hypothetical protein
MKRNRILLGVMAWWGASLSLAAPLTPSQQAFADAQALAASAQANAVSNLSSGGISSTVGQFNQTYYNSNGTAPESTLFQNGNGNTVSAGQAKVADCQTGTPNPDPFLRQNCEAINLMVNNPSNRPQIAIPQSLFAASRAIEAQGVTDPNAAGSFTSCVNNTVTPPPTTEICSEWFGIASQQCTIGRVIQVDVNTNYQCDKTATTYLPQSCDKTVNVTITQPAPIAATPVYVDVFTAGVWISWSQWSGSTDNGRMTSYWKCSTTGELRNRSVFCSGSRPAATCSPPAASLCPNRTDSVFSHYSCPTNTTLSGTGTNSVCIYPAVVSSSINNGCSVLEAAAL